MQFRHKDNSLWCTSGFYFGTLTVLNIYINDLSRTSDQFHFVLFADDTNAFMSDKSISSLFEKANQELKIITAWFIANKLSVNLSKTNYILFRSHRKVVSMSDLKLEIDDKEIMQVT